MSSEKTSDLLFQGTGLVLEGTKSGLTCDAQPSKEAIQASQLIHQPVKIWYGDLNKGVDTPDSASDERKDSMFFTTSMIPTGRGTMVAILDSGINTHHKAFVDGVDGKISTYSRCFVSNSTVITDKLGHGTQCAGLLCSPCESIQLLDSNKIVEFPGGIAEDVKVMVCKVVPDGTEIADIKAVCDAIDCILYYNRESDEKVDVISLSFGMPGFDYDLSRKIQEAVYEDIIVVCAASNSGKKSRQPITYPARLGHVLCIGACSANGKPTDFSPVGRELDFLAPGENIWAPTIGNDRAYDIVNGTSYAAPLVAGIVCQIIEDLRRLSGKIGEPLLNYMHNVWCIRELLKEMATVQGKHSDGSGYGSLNPKEYFEKEDSEKIRIIKKILQH